MTTTFKNVPSEIHNKILDTYLESPSIDFKTLKKMTLISKSNNSHIVTKLNFMKNPNVQHFCKLLHIDNLLLVVKRSAFGIEKLNEILTFVFEGDFKQGKNIEKLEKMCTISFPESISIEFSNNTFIIFQLLKHTIIKNRCSTVVENDVMKFIPFDRIIDNILFQFFEDLYVYKQKIYLTHKTKSSQKNNSNSLHFSPETINYSWHMIGFNLYFVYEKYRQLSENTNVTKKDFKDFKKNILSTNHEISKNSIKYITQQAYEIEVNDKYFIFVISFIISEMIKQKLVYMEDKIRLQYEDEYGDSVKRYEKLSVIHSDFQQLLQYVSPSLLSIMKNSPGST